MRCLVAVDDPMTRDAVAAAAEAFSDVEADTFRLEKGRDALRRRRYDFGFVTIKSDSEASRSMLADVREIADDLLLVGLTPKSAVSGRRSDRNQFRLFALLGTPIEPVQLYSTLRRLIERVETSRVQRAAAGARRRRA